MTSELEEVGAALAGAPRVRAALAAHRDGRIIGYVVPAHNTAATSAWRDAFRRIYEEPADPDGFDARGWVSSIDGAPLSESQMREWRDTTVAALRREPVGRVLEIGCGNGLLATELIGDCAAYVGTDIVGDGLDAVRARLDERATLLRMEATDVQRLDGVFDLVILNSVIQYFPDTRYLVDVLDQAAGRLAPGGRIFVGDVRHRSLAERLYTERAHARLSTPTPEKIARVVRVQRDSEAELLVDPGFFAAFAARLGPSWTAAVEPKRGRYDNELSRYRYDVTLRPSGSPGVPAGEVVAWSDVAARLAAGESPVVALDVPNARLEPGGVHPEDVYDLAAAHGYRCRLDWTHSGESGAFDVYLSRAGEVAPIDRGTPTDLVRAPRLGDDDRLAEAVRAHAAAILAPHLVPDRVVVVDELPGQPSAAIIAG